MDKNTEIRTLRAQGLSIRDISKRTKIAKSTVHKILKINPDKDTDMRQAVPDRVKIGRLEFQFVHMPFHYFCPSCEMEQNHAWLCFECGGFIPAECDCSVHFGPSEVVRRAEVI